MNVCSSENKSFPTVYDMPMLTPDPPPLHFFSLQIYTDPRDDQKIAKKPRNSAFPRKSLRPATVVNSQLGQLHGAIACSLPYFKAHFLGLWVKPGSSMSSPSSSVRCRIEKEVSMREARFICITDLRTYHLVTVRK